MGGGGREVSTPAILCFSVHVDHLASLSDWVLGQQLRGGASGSAFQESAQGMPMLLLHLLHFGKQGSMP